MYKVEAYTSLVPTPASPPQKSRSDFKVGSDFVASGPKGTGLPQAMNIVNKVDYMQLPKERKAMNHHAAKLHGDAIATSVPRPLGV